MFKLAKEATFWWRTEILVPTGDKKTAVSCELEFRAGDEADADAAASLAAAHSDLDWVARKIVGWKDVADESGNPLPLTPENLRAFLAIDYVRASVVRGYLAAVNGQALARKN